MASRWMLAGCRSDVYRIRELFRWAIGGNHDYGSRTGYMGRENNATIGYWGCRTSSDVGDMICNDLFRMGHFVTSCCSIVEHRDKDELASKHGMVSSNALCSNGGSDDRRKRQ